MPPCVIYVTEEHLVFVKRTLTYLAVIIIQWRRRQDSVGEGERGEDRDRGLDKARVRLD